MRAAQMAQKTGMRLIGAVENMSYLVGTGQEVFGSGGGEALAQAIDAPLLGKVPLDPRLRECADAGEPLVWAEPENETARTLVELAEAITAAGKQPGTVKKPLSRSPPRNARRPQAPLGPIAASPLAAAAVEQCRVVRDDGRVRAQLPAQRGADDRRRPVAEEARPPDAHLAGREAVEVVAVVDHG